MIVDPDFFDHWKTQMLVDLSKDDSSPLWVLRLWSHAQARRTGTFDNLPPAAIKAVTKASRHRAEQISAWLEEAGFIRRDGLKVELHQWEEYNKGLFANWKNGPKGGRPRKPQNNPTETHGLAMDNPSLPLHSIPDGNGGVDGDSPPAREPGSQGDSSPPAGNLTRGRPKNIEEAVAYAAEKQGYEESVVREWFANRDRQDWETGGNNPRPITNWRSDLDAWVLREARERKNGNSNNGNRADKTLRVVPPVGGEIRGRVLRPGAT